MNYGLCIGLPTTDPKWDAHPSNGYELMGKSSTVTSIVINYGKIIYQFRWDDKYM